MITQRFIATLGLAAIVVAVFSTLYLMSFPDYRLGVDQEAGIVVSVTASFCVLCIPLRRLLLWGNDWRTIFAIVTAPVTAGVGLWITFAWIWPWYETL